MTAGANAARRSVPGGRIRGELEGFLGSGFSLGHPGAICPVLRTVAEEEEEDTSSDPGSKPDFHPPSRSDGGSGSAAAAAVAKPSCCWSSCLEKLRQRYDRCMGCLRRPGHRRHRKQRALQLQAPKLSVLAHIQFCLGFRL